MNEYTNAELAESYHSVYLCASRLFKKQLGKIGLAKQAIKAARPIGPFFTQQKKLPPISSISKTGLEVLTLILERGVAVARDFAYGDKVREFTRDLDEQRMSGIDRVDRYETLSRGGLRKFYSKDYGEE